MDPSLVPSEWIFAGWSATAFARPGAGMLLISDGYRVDLGRWTDVGWMHRGMEMDVTHWMAIPKRWIRTLHALPPEWEYVLTPDPVHGAAIALWTYAMVRPGDDDERPRWTSLMQPRLVRRWMPLPPPPRQLTGAHVGALTVVLRTHLAPSGPDAFLDRAGTRPGPSPATALST